MEEQLSDSTMLIDRIRQEDKYNAFITLAEMPGAGTGPLAGVPVAYKDLFYTKGIRTTAGSLLFKDFVPHRDAEVVTRMRDAGAFGVGKTNLHELAFGITSQNPHFGPVLNPHDTDRIPGGSSGGSAAAVLLGWVPIALGTDTGGSIRVPASYCGIVGFKPTYDLVSRDGVLPLAHSLDHVGPMTATVADCVRAMEVLAESFVPKHLTSLQGIRVGVPENFFFERLHPGVKANVANCIEGMREDGAVLVPITVPDPENANAVARLVQSVEVAGVYNGFDLSAVSSDIRALIEQGRTVTPQQHEEAQINRRQIALEWDAVWERIDVLVTPTTPITAPLRAQKTVTIDGIEEETRMATTRLVRPFNLLGNPAISIPFGKSEGLPVGVQIVAKLNDDAALLAVAERIANLPGTPAFGILRIAPHVSG